jgi:hypothetical protein
LYEQCTEKNISVEKVAQDEWVIHFKVRLSPIIRDQWYNLAQKLNEVVLAESMDAVVWKWVVSKKFTVKSVYDHLTKK